MRADERTVLSQGEKQFVGGGCGEIISTKWSSMYWANKARSRTAALVPPHYPIFGGNATDNPMLRYDPGFDPGLIHGLHF
jgi:hypothetical protein